MDEIIILLEKKRKNVTHDGMLKKILEEVAHLCSHLLAMRSLLDEEESPKDSLGFKEEESPKDSLGFKEEESPKDSSGWEEKAKKVAASEQGTSKGEDRSLPRSNKKCKRKTCSSKFAVMKHMYQWMFLFLLFGTPVTADNVYREDFRKIVIATDETQIATDPILRRDDYLVYFVFAIDGNDDRIGYECTSDFVSTNQSCRIVAGDRSRAECEGLQISMNGSYTYLAVDGSKLTYDRTTFCILQRVPLPGSPILYTLGVSKEQDQGSPVEIEQKPYRYMSVATNETIVATEPVRTPHSYLIFARGGNYSGSYECTPDFVAKHQNCSIVRGEENKTECEGLRITGNETHFYLIGNVAKLTNEHTMFCILERVPGPFHFYTLVVSKKRDQDINECGSNPCQNGGTCVDRLDSFTCNCAKGYDGANCEIAPETTDWKLAFDIVVPFLIILCAFFTILYIHERLRSKLIKLEHNVAIEM